MHSAVLVVAVASSAFQTLAQTGKWPPQGKTGDWKKIGPWGIGDDVAASGEAGTLADAVSPASKYVLCDIANLYKCKYVCVCI